MRWSSIFSDKNEAQRFIDDVATLSNTSTTLRHTSYVELAGVIAAALLSILDADFTCIVVPRTADQPGLQVFKTDNPSLYSPEMLPSAFHTGKWHPSFAEFEIYSDATSARTLRLTSCPLGAESGAFIGAGSSRADFPSDMDRILMGLAVTQMTLCLQHSTAEGLKRRFAAVAEHVPDLVGVTGLDGVMQYLNRSGRTVVGLDEQDDASAKSIADLVAPQERHWVHEEIWPAAMETGRWVGTLSMQNFRTGEAFPLHADWFRIDELRNSQPVNLATVSRDLRESRRIESEVDRLNQALARQMDERNMLLQTMNEKLASEAVELRRTDMRLRHLQRQYFQAARSNIAGQMISAIAHELNQPLTAAANSLTAASRLVAGKSGVSGILREVLDEGAAQCLLAGQIINRLRRFLGGNRITARTISLVTVVEDAATIALIGFETSGLQLSTSFDPDTAHIAADRVQIQQVLVNLLRNALEAADSPVREINVTTRRVAEMAEVSVADNGPGVLKDIAPRLFEPFFSTKENGIGLGLPLCRSIVEAHGGRIWNEPAAANGAVFRFTIPAVKSGRSDVKTANNLSGR